MSKIAKQDNGCWLWTGSLSRDGYGNFHANNKTMLAHRFSYQFHYGVLPDAEICHSCDTPACVRPDHLFPGTHLQNMRDANRKGRVGGKLTFAIAEEMRSLAGTLTRAELAARYGVHLSMVQAVLSRRSWRE